MANDFVVRIGPVNVFVDGSDPIFKRELERVSVDWEESIIFLAKIIPEKTKEQIRKEMESNPTARGKLALSYGMETRNTLRIGGFRYLPHIMDMLWFDWLHEAVYLPEDKIVLTDSIEERIKNWVRAMEENDPIANRSTRARIALKLLCKIGIHKWSKPTCVYHASSNVRDCEAHCKRCSKRKTWIEVEQLSCSFV